MQATNRKELRNAWLAANRQSMNFIDTNGEFIGTLYADGEWFTSSAHNADNSRVIWNLDLASSMRATAKDFARGSDEYRSAIARAWRYILNARELREYIVKVVD